MEKESTPTTLINEALMRDLVARKIGNPRFRLKLAQAKAAELIYASYHAEVIGRKREPDMSDFTEDKIKRLSIILTQETPRFGILLCGSVGNGKTTLLYAFQSALNYLRDVYPQSLGEYDYKKGILIKTAKELMDMWRCDYNAFEDVKNRPMLAIDELGEEPLETQSYGNISSPIVDLLEKRYDRQLFTLASTNLSPKEIGDKYGLRIADRFREMFEIISFGDEVSFRQRRI